ncbi:rod shape-determining protein RodA [Dialister micraerophilus]|uniref:rod shape-determining protein RodA n=1 Tax=Dialister micraerophilus TaxID=309120 RepID=UPI0023F0B83D|nr:rod shape-determining protein RodA [Dialister micraerophilus]
MYLIRYLRRVVSTLIFTVLGLVFISLLIIGSATHANIADKPGQFDFVIKQGVFLIVGIIFSIFTLRFDYKILYKWSNWLYVINLIFLLIVKFAGTSALGAQRWIQIGPITLQPSEFAKFFMIISLAKLLSKHPEGFKTWKSLIPVVALMFAPTLLIFIQPDLGTSLVFAAITMGMLFICGLEMKLVKRALLGLMLVMPFIWFFVLHSYQKMRIMVLFNPNVDPFGSGYHVIQSKISIGSGGFIGQGLFAGTQSQLNFLPENHTDFIFSVIGEELGFIGAILILFLYFVLLYRAISISKASGDSFGSLIACGIFSMWLFQVFINVGMTLGIMPVTGIPLPFMSYGGSALVMNLLCVGLLMNIYLRRKKLMFD